MRICYSTFLQKTKILFCIQTNTRSTVSLLLLSSTFSMRMFICMSITDHLIGIEWGIEYLSIRHKENNTKQSSKKIKLEGSIKSSETFVYNFICKNKYWENWLRHILCIYLNNLKQKSQRNQCILLMCFTLNPWSCVTLKTSNTVLLKW